MTINYPAGTTTIRNLTTKYNYFLVVKPDDLADDIPQIEYFVYRFMVSISAKDGIKSLKEYFKGTELLICRELSDTDYATGEFEHPHYLNQLREPLTLRLKDIPIYFQTKPRTINLNTDLYTYGTKPIIKGGTSSIEYTSSTRTGGNPI